MRSLLRQIFVNLKRIDNISGHVKRSNRRERERERFSCPSNVSQRYQKYITTILSRRRRRA